MGISYDAMRDVVEGTAQQHAETLSEAVVWGVCFAHEFQSAMKGPVKAVLTPAQQTALVADQAVLLYRERGERGL